MKRLLLALAAVTALFALLALMPLSGHSVAAFALSAGSASAVCIALYRLITAPDRKRYQTAKKLLEYLPFIQMAAFVIRRSGHTPTGFWYDLPCALLWLALYVLSLVILWHLSEKRVSRWLKGIEPASQGRKGLLVHILEWADALVQSACLVLLVNIFLFQLYAIPSESMVPEFMVGDRVAVLKTPSGPRFPLSQVGIPRFREYNRGDIVVFSNPHYNDTREDQVRSFVSQLVYMLTFTSVNINRDEYGAVKADPLVKRVVGVPGEKLMMLNGILYSKTRTATDWDVVQEDAGWATWNLAALPRSQKALVRQFPLSQEDFLVMESVESSRAALTVTSAAAEAASLVERFGRLKSGPETVSDVSELVSRNRREVQSLYRANEELTRLLMTTNGGRRWFTSFMTDWLTDLERANPFDEQSMHLNLLVKLNLGRLIVRNAELIQSNASAQAFVDDRQRKNLLIDAQQYLFYLALHDQRNMPEFPVEPDSYLGEGDFFLMGDNRFNSLDMRHSYSWTLRELDGGDPWTVLYRSNISPRSVNLERILGTAALRFWPPSRAGIPE